MIIGVLVGLCFEVWAVYWILREGDFMGLIWSLLATIIVRFVYYANNYIISFWRILIIFIIIPILAFIVRQYIRKESTQKKIKLRKAIYPGTNHKDLGLRKLINLRSIFEPKEIIGESNVSNMVKPIFDSAFAICREFGFEENGYFNYHYKNKIIDIYHLHQDKSELDSFSPGKTCVVNYKGTRVFDCTIRMSGSIKLETYIHGDWENYFNLLKKRIKDNTNASALCERIYKLMMNRTGVSQLAIVKKDSYAKAPEFNKIYNKYTYTFTDNDIEIVFFTTDNDIIGSAVKIKYKNEEVFDAIHYRPKYCTKTTPYSTNTRCNQYKRGQWERYLEEVFEKYEVHT